MTTVNLSTKGQLIIPKEIRDRHGWSAGTRLEIVDHGDSIQIRAAVAVAATTLDDLIGCLAYDGAPKSLGEMESAIEAAARRQR